MHGSAAADLAGSLSRYVAGKLLPTSDLMDEALRRGLVGDG